MKNLVFGITGGIACGKSGITATFQKLGIPILDADVLARELVEPGQPYLTKIIEAFGAEFLDEQGTLRRKELGNLVFSQPDKLRMLNSIMAEGLRALANTKIRNLQESGCRLIGYDAALIIEMGMQDLYRPLIVVYCSAEVQKTRLMARNNLTEQQALDRIQAQMSTESKLQYADYVIDTMGSREDTAKQVEKILKELEELIDESRTVTEANSL